MSVIYCNYIFQNILVLIILFIYYYIFLKDNWNYWNFKRKFEGKKTKEDEKAFDSFFDTLGWQAFVGGVALTILLFINKKSALFYILKVFGITICVSTE